MAWSCVRVPAHDGGGGAGAGPGRSVQQPLLQGQWRGSVLGAAERRLRTGRHLPIQRAEPYRRDSLTTRGVCRSSSGYLSRETDHRRDQLAARTQSSALCRHRHPLELDAAFVVASLGRGDADDPARELRHEEGAAWGLHVVLLHVPHVSFHARLEEGRLHLCDDAAFDGVLH